MRPLLLILALYESLIGQVFTYTASNSPVPSSFFGMTSGHPGQTVPGWVQAGINRTLNEGNGPGGDLVNWGDIETSSGVYNWGPLDGLVSSSAAFGIPDTVYSMNGVPAWNSPDPGVGNTPNPDPSAFISFVNQITQRYCGVIKYWEGWNEANSLDGWNASISLLITYMSQMYTAVHSAANCACVGNTCSPGLAGGVNPNKVTTPALSSPAFFTGQDQGNNGSNGFNVNLTYWLNKYLTQGAVGTFDIAALHSYGPVSTCYPGPEAFVTDVASFKNIIAQHQSTLPPLWNTEMNWGLNTCTSSGADQDSWIARYFFLHWAMGFQRAIWYEYDQPGGTFGLIAPSSNQLATYNETRNVMIGATMQNCQQFSNSNWTCRFTRSSPMGYIAIAAWNSTGSGSYIVPFGITQYRDVLGNITATTPGTVLSLTTSPLLMETQSAF